jgi:hypothetical protein
MINLPEENTVKTKTVKWDTAREGDKELWEYLQTLPHGMFSTETRKFWTNHMRERGRQTKK